MLIAELIAIRRVFWIGCDDLDRLLTYPDVRYLSGCARCICIQGAVILCPVR